MRLIFRLMQSALFAAAIAVATWLTIRHEHDFPGWAVILVAAFVGAAGPVDAAVRELFAWREGLSFDRRLKVEDALKGLLVSLHRASDIPWTELGFTAFVVQRTPRHFVRCPDASRSPPHGKHTTAHEHRLD